MKAKGFFGIALAMLVVLSLLVNPFQARAAGNIWVVKTTFSDDSNCTSTQRLCKTIQAAVDNASTGDVILIYPGEYPQTVNIEGKTNLIIRGFGSVRTIVKPINVLDWNYMGITTGRKAAIRLINSTNITLQGITLDLDSVKGNNVFGLLIGDSTGSLKQSVIKNNTVADTSGGYYEFGMAVRTVSSTYHSNNRAVFLIEDSLFKDVGRVGINAHHWSHIVIKNSTFEKTVADFGYGIEIGSTSTAEVINSIFKGFNTPAASDNSSSAGIYIVNAFTLSITDPIEKSVKIKFCKIYNNQIGITIGNEWNNFAGNVDINVEMAGNEIYGNGRGVVIADEDKANGSSVTVQAYNNVIRNNSYGYDIYTMGDGEIHTTITGDTITNNSQGGVLVEHTGSIGSSIYDVNVTSSNISENGTQGIYADSGISVQAPYNWWGSSAGPGAGGNNGVAGGGSISTSPFAVALTTGVTASVHEVGESGTLDSHVTANGLYGAQLHVTHDPSVLSFQSGVKNDVSTASPVWAWDEVVEDFVATSSGRRLSGSMRNDLHSQAANLSGQSIATWTYKCEAPGGSNLLYNMTAGTGTILADKDGFPIATALTGGTMLCTPKTATKVEGIIQLQGRLGTSPAPAGWNDAYVTLTCVSSECSGYGPFVMVTNANGHYEWVKNMAGTGIPVGTYSVSVVRRAYLGAVKSTTVTINAGDNTITPTPTLLGGEVTGDEAITIADLTLIGGAFGTSVTPDTGPDVNGDGTINILDLVLAGGNYGLTASTWP